MHHQPFSPPPTTGSFVIGYGYTYSAVRKEGPLMPGIPTLETPSLLIRRFDRKEHAEMVNEGKLGCRSLLSCLFTKTNGSYQYVDYFEETFARELFSSRSYLIPQADFLTGPRRQLLHALCDPILAGTYMTFAHTVDPDITPSWLDSQDGGYYAFLTPHYQYGQYFIGDTDEYIVSGQAMRYVRKAEDIDPRTTLSSNPWIVPALDRELAGGIPEFEKNLLIQRYACLFAALFNRVLGEGTSPMENEFRILRWDSRTSQGGDKYSSPKPLFHKLEVDGKYYLVRSSPLHLPSLPLCGPWSTLTAVPQDDPNCSVNLLELLNAGHDVHPYLAFEDIDLNLIAENWECIGGLNTCRTFINSWLKGNRRRKESSAFHWHHGPWPQTIIRRIRRYDEISHVIPSEEKGYFKS